MSNNLKNQVALFKNMILNNYQNQIIDPIILLEINLLRFLKARDYNINQALDMFINVNTWRHNINIYNISNLNINSVTKIKKYFPSYWLTLDKVGHPVYVECPGIINIKQLMKITTIDKMTNIYIQNSEYMFTHLFDLLSKNNKSNITQTLSIIDLKGYSFKNFTKEVCTYIKNIIHIGNSYYPETTYKMFIINTPFLFNTIWNLLKPLIPKRTRNKIFILKKGQETILYDFIDKDKLPNDLNFTNIKNADNSLEKNYLKWLKKKQLSLKC